jgi:hypothetical protein
MSLLQQASLIVTPNAYKEGKLYSVIPSDGSGDMSVTRATTATRVNSAGLVELVPYNLLQRSQEFNVSPWVKIEATITANDTSAPDGTLTADKLIATSVNSSHFTYQGFNAQAQTYTFSTYAKKGEYDYLVVRLDNDITVTKTWFNLSNGTIGTTEGGSPTITNVGNGWYRVTMTYSSTIVQAIYGVLYNSNADNVLDFAGDSTSGIFIWGAQLVEGTTAKDYFATETRLNIPRLDYSNGSCPSLLVEPQRTNLALQSSSFDNAAWDKGGVTVVANNVTSPDGTQNADKISEDSANGNHLFYNITPPSTTTATASVFYKKGTRQFFSIKIQIGANSYTQVFDAENLTATSNSSNGLTSVSNTITDFGNGWVRATLSGTNPAGAGDTYVIYSLSNSATPTFDSGNKNPTYQGSTSEYGYFWGAQLEAGSYSTSYIPTTSASVTRNADAISKTGISSLIGQTEGTLFIDIVFKNPLTSINRFMSITEAGWQADGSIRIEMNTSELTVDIVNNGSSIGAITYLGTFTPNTRYKIAVAYKQNDCQMYFNGINAGSDTSTGVMPTCFQLYLNALGGGFNAPYEASNINAAALWKTRLTDDQLEILTGNSFYTYAEMASYYNYTLQ